MISREEAKRLATLVTPPGQKMSIDDTVRMHTIGTDFPSAAEVRAAAEKAKGKGMDFFEEILRGSASVIEDWQPSGSGSPPISTISSLEELMNWAEPLEGIPAATIRRALRYHMNVNKRHWFKDNMNEAFLRRHFREMIAEVPLAYENVVPNTGKSVFTDFKKLAEQEMLEKFRPTCSECKGTGEIVATGPVKGMKPCPACHEAKLLIFNRIALGK